MTLPLFPGIGGQAAAHKDRQGQAGIMGFYFASQEIQA